ncbi:MAG: NAD-binding protein [Nocardioides sp.]|nr:NAD-binding protein [Nocardioides sp.]
MTRVVVCGIGDEGLGLVEQMVYAGAEVVVVEQRPAEWLRHAVEDAGATLVAADPRRSDSLVRAGIGKAGALVCAEADDVTTLAIALLAREMSPELRVVVHMRNAAVGRALTGLGVHVLDTARLAAGSVVDACLRAHARTLQLGPEQVRVLETRAPRPGTLRDLYGDLAPLAVGDGDSLHLAPGRDTAVSEGDHVVLVGRPEEIAPWEPRARRVPTYTSARGPWPRQRVSVLGTLLAAVDRRVKIAFGALGLLVTVSMTMLLLGYREPDGTGMSPLDALYFTVETIGTVGFGDFYFRDQSDWLRAWAILLMIVGATLATVFFALLTNMLVSRRIEESLGRRRITGLEGHVVVIGAGSVGVAVVEEVRRRGVPAVVVDADPQNRFRGQLATAEVPVIAADATLRESLLDARTDHARGVAVMTSDDMVNVETGLAVRDVIADVPVVLRVFDRRLAHTVTGFGFDEVRSPALLAAPWFVGAALGFVVEATFYVAGEPMLVGRARIGEGSRLDGRPLRDLGARILVAGVARGDGCQVTPRSDTALRAGDEAYLIGPYRELLRVLGADE